MKKLFVCERPYMLYKTLIKAVLNKEDKMDIVLSNHMPGMEKMEPVLRESGLFNEVYFYDDFLYQEYIRNERLKDYVEFPKILISWMKKMLRYRRFHKLAAKEQLPENLDFRKYDEIYVIDGASTINLKLNFSKIEYVVSEHAKNNFQYNIPLHKLAVRISIVLDRLNIVVAYSGCSKYVSAIEVSENKNLVSYLKGKKIIVYNVEEMVKTLTDDMKNKIYELYATAYGVSLSMDTNTNLLLTMPILVDGYVKSQKEMQLVWKSLVNEYGDENCQLLIKAHPRDETDYKKIFPDCIVIDHIMTAQVLAFAQNLNIVKVLNLQSSTIGAFEGKYECITVGLEYIDKITNAENDK